MAFNPLDPLYGGIPAAGGAPVGSVQAAWDAMTSLASQYFEGGGRSRANNPIQNLINQSEDAADPGQAIQLAAQAIGQMTGQTPAWGGASGGSAPTAARQAAAVVPSSILDHLLSAESSYIPSLLSTNYRSTVPGEAAYESAAEPINTKYDALKEQVLNNAARQGVAGSSGIVQDQLNQVEIQRARALSGLERDFNAQIPQRQGQGISQLTSLLGLEQQRQLESLGIQQSLDAAARQNILDLLGATGNQGAAAAQGAANIGSSLLGAAGNLSSLYGARAANQAQGLGSLLGSIGTGLGSQPSQTSLYGGANAYTTYPTYEEAQAIGSPVPNPYNVAAATGGFGGF